MNLYAISYWANMAMFIPVPLLLALFISNSLSNGSPSRLLAITSSIVGILAVVFFLVAQATWVLYGHNEPLPPWAVNIWLAFDGANAAYYLASSTVLYIQSVWIKKRRGYEELKRMIDANSNACLHNKKPSQ